LVAGHGAFTPGRVAITDGRHGFQPMMFVAGIADY
jgi:hypothetical protein